MNLFNPLMLYLIRYSEIGTKGDNRSFFEGLLARNIKAKMNEKGISGDIKIEQARLVVNTETNINDILKKTFGIASFSIVKKINPNPDDIKSFFSNLKVDKKFRVSVNRRSKNFPYSSQEFAGILGEIVLKNNPQAKVDLENYDINLGLDIGDDWSYFYDNIYDGPGGIPVRSQGKGVVLISGGIDSPVAAYLMLKRGMEISLIHYFQSSRLLEKVFRNKELLEEYSPYPIEIKIVDHRKLLGPTVLKLRKEGKERWTCLFCKNLMYKEAEKYAKEIGARAIVTGENLGQVASQTLDNLATIESDFHFPIFRPLIGFDKLEIEKISEKIGAFDIFISVASSCDCFFLPPRPKTRSDSSEFLELEAKIIGETHDNID